MKRMWWLALLAGLYGGGAGAGDLAVAPAGEDEGPALAEVRPAVAGHLGEPVRWGGRIVGLERDPAGAWVEVRELRLDASGMPLAGGSAGTFLVRVEPPLTDARFAVGREVTVRGTLEAEVDWPAGGAAGRLPVVRARGYVLWNEPYTVVRRTVSTYRYAPPRQYFESDYGYRAYPYRRYAPYPGFYSFSLSLRHSSGGHRHFHHPRRTGVGLGLHYGGRLRY